MDKKKEEHKEQIENLQQDFLKERDEPNRLSKGNENLKKAVEHLRSDLDKLKADTDSVEAQFKHEEHLKMQYEKQREQITKEQADKEIKRKELITSGARIEEMQNNLKNENLWFAGEKVRLDTESKAIESSKKSQQEKTNHYNKRVDDEKKTFKKIEYDNDNIENNVKEFET